MLNFGTFFLWSLAACFLWRGSLAEDRQSHFVCLLDDPDPNQCDSFCLNELRPLLKEVLKGQDRGITCDADNETKAKLGRLVGQQARFRGNLQEVKTKLEGRLQELTAKMDGVEAKLKGQLQGLEAKLEGRLQEVLTKLAESLAKLEGNLLAVKTSPETKPQATVNKSKNQNPLHAVSTTTEANVNISSGFEKIGTRYFKIVNEMVDWITAERKCREMGGYLAAFRNEDEINAIAEKIKRGRIYWLGLNDRDSEGHFVSVASNKPAQFFKWFMGEPDNYDNNENCVNLNNGEMWDERCDYDYYFICQADNET